MILGGMVDIFSISEINYDLIWEVKFTKTCNDLGTILNDCCTTCCLISVGFRNMFGICVHGLWDNSWIDW